MNDFAKSQLMKYGWSEGKGLGKQEGGITEALQPKLKFDTAGMGHKSSDWNNWWENAFNKAASSITFNSESHTVSVSFSTEEANNSSKQNFNEKLSNYNAGYTKFLKTSTLLNGNLLEDEDITLSKKIAKENVTHIPLTDDELFNICGGRTAHKGARHGLTLNGKLKRIAQQEHDMLNTNLYKSISTKINNKAKAKLNNNKSQMIVNENTILPTTSAEEPSSKVTKSSRKRVKRHINALTHQLNTLCKVSDSNKKNMHVKTDIKLKDEKKGKHRKRKRRKEKSLSISYDIKNLQEGEVDNVSGELSTLREEEKDLIDENVKEKLNVHIDYKFSATSMSMKKKKRKKQCPDKQYEVTTKAWAVDDDVHSSQSKKRKKSDKCNSNFQLSIDNEINTNINTLDNLSPASFSNNVALGSCDVEESSAFATDPVKETYFKEKADYLNAKITKKKLAKLHKKEKMRLAKITNCLETIHLNVPESVEAKYV